jgi:hypothetical protein
MPSGKVTSNSATKSFGTQNASKSSDSFSINASAIPITLSSLPNEKNVQSAMDRITNHVATSDSAPGSPYEGDLWYDTDDDKIYVRDDDSWNEIVSSSSGTVDGGSY